MNTQKREIDCLFIGHNEMAFSKYESSIRKMGMNSGAYRDLNLNFLYTNNTPYSLPEIFNLLCCTSREPGRHFQPIQTGDVFSLAIAYLGSYLHRRGHTFDYINSFQSQKAELARKLERESILSIAIITTLYVSVWPILEIIRFIKEHNPTVKIIIGGPYVATQVRSQEEQAWKYLFESIIQADFYVNSSQGEATLVNLIKALKTGSPLDQVNNLYYKTGMGYQSTAIEKEDNKLTENPVQWELFSDDIKKHVNIRTSISCPFSCSYCGFPEHAGKYQTMAVDVIEQELKKIAQIPGIRSVNFIDDTFNVPKKRFTEILRMMIKNNFKFKWHSYFRCQYADKETIKLMKESGCEGVFLGIESGNDQILRNMNKSANVNKYLEGIALLKEFAIITFGSFIIGFPGETVDTVQDTVKFIKSSDLDFYRTQLWYCENITPIWKERDKYEIKGNRFEWQHITMASHKACDLLEEMMIAIDNPVWIPQYNFDFNGIWQFIHLGMKPDQVKNFLRAFANGLKEKLTNPSRQELTSSVIGQLKQSCGNDIDMKQQREDKAPGATGSQYRADFDF